LGGWSEDNFKHWQISTIAINSEFDHYSRGMCLPNVATNDNKNLSSAQKELLLWHWKLGIGMQRIQELMRVNQVEEPDGATSTMDRVITPQIKAAANCPIPVCQSCQLSRARIAMNHEVQPCVGNNQTYLRYGKDCCCC
jgi:hypothetical protein